MANFLSTPTVVAVGLTCKLFLNSPFCSVTVNGLPILLNALNNEEGRGVVTVSNHISTLDDPLAWGVLPTRLTFSTRTTRWALGASDIMFTNPVFSAFFRTGQVLETFRGKGVYQQSVDTAIEKLDQGNWVHLFGEGKVNQSHTFEKDENIIKLPRFKWGIGRVLMESAVQPVVIPMWLTGFDTLMPEGRSFPWNYIPKLGCKLSITFGEPLLPEEIKAALHVVGQEESIPRNNLHSPVIRLSHTNPAVDNLCGADRIERVSEGARESINFEREEKMKIEHVRSMVTAVIQRGVEALGRRVQGDSLGKEDA